jgi:hypothetical protein
MNHAGIPFCEVCSEALVLAIYQRVRPIDAFVPASTNLLVGTNQPVAFSLTLLQPSTHALDVQWFTNGTPVAGSTNVAFNLLPQSVGNGTQTVSVLAKDNTPLVRNDASNLLSQTITWTLTVNPPQLKLDSLSLLSSGRFAFRVTGTAPQGFSVQSSTNLLDWTPLQTNSLVSGQFWYTNSGRAGLPGSFYRVRTPP